MPSFSWIIITGPALIMSNGNILGTELLITSFVFLFTGTIAGFCSSAPLGPINLWIVDTAARQVTSGIKSFLLGVIFVDLLFASIAIWGYSEIFQNSMVSGLFSPIAGSFMVILGFASLWGLIVRPPNQTKKESKRIILSTPIRNFLTGGTLCGSNPAFLMFWLYTVSLINKWAAPPHPALVNIFFIAGVALGDSLWFGILIKIVRKGLNLAKPSILLFIRYAVACGFLGFGAYTLWRSNL